MTAQPLLSVENLVKHFPTGRKRLFGGTSQKVHAVDGVSFALAKGETLGLVGESGCGKSTVSRLIVRLLDPTAGSIRYDGRDISTAKGGELRRMRQHFQMVFQDPYSSLNGRFSARDLIAEPLAINGHNSGAREARINSLISDVGLSRAHLDRYPHEFSGGQRQRLGIARALALNPSLLVLDEPVSALDVSVQAQIVNLLQDIQRELGVAYVFISHDLAVVRHIATRVAVMYLGRIVEEAPATELFAAPLHPYTRSLIAAAPRPDPTVGRVRASVEGDAPSALSPPPGCAFHPRCPLAIDRCRIERPELRVLDNSRVACHLAEPATDRATLRPLDPDTPLGRRLAVLSAARLRQKTIEEENTL